MKYSSTHVILVPSLRVTAGLLQETQMADLLDEWQLAAAAGALLQKIIGLSLSPLRPDIANITYQCHILSE